MTENAIHVFVATVRILFLTIAEYLCQKNALLIIKNILNRDIGNGMAN